MATPHTVQQGEHLSQIARQYGFRDFRSVWDHPDNAALRKLRQSPNVLLPGDVVQIPDKNPVRSACATGQVHRFQVGGQALKLRLALKDFGNEPLANAECVLHVEGRSVALVTDGKGHLEVPISADAKEATLVFTDPAVPFDVSVPIKIGHLDPVDEPSGQSARLSNLGYLTRPTEEVDATMLEHAIQELQCDFDLKVSGVCDAATQARLKELHGS